MIVSNVPSDPAHYVARLGEACAQDWSWHTAPGATGGSNATVSEYAIDAGRKMRMWFAHPDRISDLSAFREEIAFADVAYGILTDFTQYHGRRRALAETYRQVREDLRRLQTADGIYLLPDHPQFRSPRALPDRDGRTLLPVTKKERKLASWLGEKDRLEQCVREALPCLASPPDQAVNHYLLSFRRYIHAKLHEGPLTEERRSDVIRIITDKWESRAQTDIAARTTQLCTTYGIEDLFSPRTQETFTRLKCVAASVKNEAEESELQFLVSQFMLILSASEEADEHLILESCGQMWLSLQRKLEIPLYKRPEMGLAYLAAIVKRNPLKEIESELGVFEDR